MSWVRLLAVGTALMSCGCGVKGALYLPEKSGAVVTTPAPAEEPGAPAQPATEQIPAASPPAAQPPSLQPPAVPTPPPEQAPAAQPPAEQAPAAPPPTAAPASTQPTKDEDKQPH